MPAPKSVGVLHCDPHPGNLLRTADGKLCILDWGAMRHTPGVDAIVSRRLALFAQFASLLESVRRDRSH